MSSAKQNRNRDRFYSQAELWQHAREELESAVLSAAGSDAMCQRTILSIECEQYPKATIVHIHMQAEDSASPQPAEALRRVEMRTLRAAVAALGWRDFAHWQNDHELHLRIYRSNEQH